MIKSRLWRLLTLKANCGWLRPCTLGDFSLYEQRKVTKRNPPRSARLLLRARGAPIRGAPVWRRGSPPYFHDTSASPTGRSTNSPGAHHAPRAQTRSRLKAPGGAAVLGARYGVWNNTMPCLSFTLVTLRGLSDKLILSRHTGL